MAHIRSCKCHFFWGSVKLIEAVFNFLLSHNEGVLKNPIMVIKLLNAIVEVSESVVQMSLGDSSILPYPL